MVLVLWLLLIEKGGKYAELFELQARRFSEETSFIKYSDTQSVLAGADYNF